MPDFHQQYGNVQQVLNAENAHYYFGTQNREQFVYMRHLVDRHDERRQLRRHLAPSYDGRVFTAVVPGLADDSLEGFLELCHHRVLAGIAERANCGIDTIRRVAVPWHDAKAESDEVKLHHLLDETANVLNAVDESAEAIRNALIGLERHVLLWMHVSHDLWESGDEDVLAKYLAFWQTVLPLRSNQVVFHVITAMLNSDANVSGSADRGPASSEGESDAVSEDGKSVDDALSRGIDALEARFGKKDGKPADVIFFDALGRVAETAINRWATVEVQNEFNRINPQGATLDLVGLAREARNIASRTPSNGWAMVKLEDVLGNCLQSFTSS